MKPARVRSIAVMVGVAVLAIGTLAAAVLLLVRKPAPEAPRKASTPRFRIGYYEGGSYPNYDQILASMATELVALGWLDGAPDLLSGDRAAAPLWSSLSRESQSDHIVFVEEAYWSANWDDDARVALREDALARLRAGEVDVVLAFGTWGGKDLVNGEHNVPVLVISSSDPVQAGIVPSEDDSGHDHVHVAMDPTRYARQVRAYHDILAFGRLGIIYEDTVNGRSYAGVDLVQRVADEEGFELVTYVDPTENVDEAAVAEYRAGLEELAPRIDAMYVTHHGGVSLETLPQFAEYLAEMGIPSLAQGNAEWAGQGLLLSVAAMGFGDKGRFAAETLGKVLNGARPGDLPQCFEEEQGIAINLDTAQRIGFAVPSGLLSAADRIYGAAQ